MDICSCICVCLYTYMRLCVCSHIAGSCCSFPGYSEWSPPHLGHEETPGSIFMTNWKEDQGQERDIRGAACGGLVRNCIRRQIRTHALKMTPYHFRSREDKSLRPPKSWGPLKLGLVLSNDLQEKPDRMCRSGAQNDSDVGRPWVRFFSIRERTRRTQEARTLSSAGTLWTPERSSC